MFMKTRICNRCFIEKPLLKYHKDKYDLLGIRRTCKECMSMKIDKEKLSENLRRCSKCKEIKLIEEFNKRKQKKLHHDNRYGVCETCRKNYRKKYRKNHKKELKLKRREYYQKNRDKENKYVKQWAKNNKERVNKNNRENRRKRMKKDPVYRLSCVMRSILKKTFKLTGTKKEDKTVKYLGYSSKQLKQRLEINFTEKMSWNNYGEWEIDHIIPIDYFIKRRVINPKTINALSNLKPRWKTNRIINGVFYLGNQEKSNKINYE